MSCVRKDKARAASGQITPLSSAATRPAGHSMSPVRCRTNSLRGTIGPNFLSHGPVGAGRRAFDLGRSVSPIASRKNARPASFAFPRNPGASSTRQRNGIPVCRFEQVRRDG